MMYPGGSVGAAAEIDSDPPRRPAVAAAERGSGERSKPRFLVMLTAPVDARSTLTVDDEGLYPGLR